MDLLNNSKRTRLQEYKSKNLQIYKSTSIQKYMSKRVRTYFPQKGVFPKYYRVWPNTTVFAPKYHCIFPNTTVFAQNTMLFAQKSTVFAQKINVNVNVTEGLGDTSHYSKLWSCVNPANCNWWMHRWLGLGLVGIGGDLGFWQLLAVSR